MSFQLHPDTTLDVVHLYVSNVKKSLEFYTEVLSMKVLREEEAVVTFVETDAPNPVGYYGLTKHEGEKVVR
ncbi:VOC family protein, partial [Bacillus sp. HC-Mk]